MVAGDLWCSVPIRLCVLTATYFLVGSKGICFHVEESRHNLNQTAPVKSDNTQVSHIHNFTLSLQLNCY